MRKVLLFSAKLVEAENLDWSLISTIIISIILLAYENMKSCLWFNKFCVYVSFVRQQIFIEIFKHIISEKYINVEEEKLNFIFGESRRARERLFEYFNCVLVLSYGSIFPKNFANQFIINYVSSICNLKGQRVIFCQWQ